MDLDGYQNMVIYSFPEESTFYKLHQNDGGTCDEPNDGCVYFLVQTFESDVKPIYIRADINESIELDKINCELEDAPTITEQDESAYINQVKQAITLLGETNGKVVLSRVATTKFSSLNIAASLKNLREKFPMAFIYFLKTKDHGDWMGATPESLLEQWGEDFHTMALAGTKPLEELFTQKEFDEQFLVTKDLLERLQNVPVEVGDVHETIYGQIKHLRTLLQWKSDDSAIDFAQMLHPTPAVAGYPRARALKIIRELEKHNRQLYTGYLGLVDSQNSTRLFVNLRCMRMFRQEWWYFTGGGINLQSSPASEWNETVQKELSVKAAMVFTR